MREQLSCGEQTKYKIALALKDLMVEMPFEKITVSDISDKCEIHRQTFYYHFNDKNELLQYLIYEELLRDLFTNFTCNEIKERFITLFKTIRENKEFYTNLVKVDVSNAYDYLVLISQKYILSIVNDAILSHHYVTVRNDHSVAAEYIGFGLGGIVVNWIQNGMKESPEEMAQGLELFFEQVFII